MQEVKRQLWKKDMRVKGEEGTEANKLGQKLTKQAEVCHVPLETDQRRQQTSCAARNRNFGEASHINTTTTTLRQSPTDATGKETTPTKAT